MPNTCKIPLEKRNWGQFLTYYESLHTKLKRLIIEPDKSISMQYHNNRAELWFIEAGKGTLKTLVGNLETTIKILDTHSIYHIERGQWHQIINTGTINLEIVEIQYGMACIETDIVRR